jgi:hypothetical protein
LYIEDLPAYLRSDFVMPPTADSTPLDIEVLESDPAPTFVVKIGSTAIDFELRFCNEAFRRKGFDRDIHGKGREALLFRSWAQACGKFSAHHEFRDWTWIAEVAGETSTWKVVKAKTCATEEQGILQEDESNTREQTGTAAGLEAARTNDSYRGSNDEAPRRLQGKVLSTIRAIPRADLHARWESIQTMMEMSDVGVFEYNPAGQLIHANEVSTPPRNCLHRN